MTNTQRVDADTKAALGQLLLVADEISKRVITAFDPAAFRPTVNFKALSRFNLDALEPCAEFLCIELADSDGNKLFTKDTLVSRIILAIKALLPSTCSECLSKYTVELDANEKPLYYCHMCFQGSHNCDALKSKHDALNSSTDALAGIVWLCHKCLASSKPIKPRQSKSKMQPSSTATTSGNQAGTQNGDLSNSDGAGQNQNVVDNENLIEDDDPEDDDPEDEDPPQSSQICPDYAIGNCLHGSNGQKEVDGAKCTFQHPKRCRKYCRNGSKGQHGCKKGEKCEHFHPKLCMNSVRKRVCTKKDCKLVHLINTSRTRQPKKKVEKPKESSIQPGKSAKSKDKSNDFLELKSLIASMRTTFQNEISSIKMGLMNQQAKIPVPTMLPWMNQQLLNPFLHQYPMIPTGSGVNFPPASC